MANAAASSFRLVPTKATKQNSAATAEPDSSISSCVARVQRPASLASRSGAPLDVEMDQTETKCTKKRGRPRLPLPELGERYGNLIYAGPAELIGSRQFISVTCDCGSTKTIRLTDWRRDTVSCGCRRIRGGLTRRHGDWRSAEYKIWTGMLARCSNENVDGYKDYGGRGIAVSERWRDYAAFLNDMGRRPSPEHQIDRINNDGNYEPGKTILNRLYHGVAPEASVSAGLRAPEVRR